MYHPAKKVLGEIKDCQNAGSCVSSIVRIEKDQFSATKLRCLNLFLTNFLTIYEFTGVTGVVKALAETKPSVIQ